MAKKFCMINRTVAGVKRSTPGVKWYDMMVGGLAGLPTPENSISPISRIRS
jgi:hypothetical protein